MARYFLFSFRLTVLKDIAFVRNATIKRAWWSRTWDRYKAKDRGKERSSARESVDAREVWEGKDGGKSTIAEGEGINLGEGKRVPL